MNYDMNFLKELISTLEKKHYPFKETLSDDDWPLAEAVCRILETKSKVFSVYDEFEEEEKSHKKKIHDLEHKLQTIRNNCRHELTKYYPDASGNNDSHTRCLICEKIIS